MDICCLDVYSLSLDAGLNRAGGMRRMAKGASVVTYRLFDGDNIDVEVGHAGIDDSYPLDPLTGTGTGVAQTRNFLAIAYPGSVESSIIDTGTHSDTVTVKVTF